MTPKERCERLLEAVLPFAEQTLNKYGEFYPFGACLGQDGQISLLQPDTGTERPEPDELVALAKNSFRRLAAENTITTSAVVVNMRLRKLGKDDVDAIAVMLDDREDYSIIMYYPYSKEERLTKRFRFEAPLTQAGENAVFQDAKLQ